MAKHDLKKIRNNHKKQEIKLTYDAIEKIKRETALQAIDALIPYQLFVLREQEGWGKKKLKRFHDNFMDLIDSAHKGYVTVDDIKKTLIDEAGVKFD